MKSNKSIIPYIFSISLIYFLFVFSFYIVLYFDKDFLLKLFAKFNVYKNLPFELSMDEARKIATELMDYLRGARNFLETTISINGKTKELYSITAKIHMADVKNIFLLNIKCHYFAISISILCLFYCLRHNININEIFNAYKDTLLILSIFVVIIIVYASIDFDSFFMNFHKLIFTNEYYLFNPNVDYIILMLPEDLFQYIGFLVVSLFIVLNLLSITILYLLKRIQHRP